MQFSYYRKGFLRIAEIWFQEPGQRPDADIVRCMQTAAPVRGACCDPFNTLTIDLKAADDAILAGMEKNTRYEVRRAETRDGVRYEHLPAQRLGDLQQFLDAYADHGVSHYGASYPNLAKLRQLAASGYLDLSAVVDQEGQTLSWHVHIVADGVARLLYSVSPRIQAADFERQNLRGRANRLHHWRDMQRFKQAGCRCYDFGGFYMGMSDAKKLQINRFKKGFGGELVLTYNCLRPLTLKGRLALTVWQFLKRREQ